ncbi:transposase [Streptomyces sp. B21-105]|uniref:transposase n=1 Tax=Streptomyces sp. B21-105 TaxID=3039417 RepID=UPI002FEF6DC1
MSVLRSSGSSVSCVQDQGSRPGNAGSNTATDHITAAQLTLAQLPKKCRRGRRTLIRTDSAGGTHDFVAWLAQRGRWLSYSVGMVITEQVHQHVLKVPASAWTAAVEAGGEIRDGAWVAELTGDVLDAWSPPTEVDKPSHPALSRQTAHLGTSQRPCWRPSLQ